MDRPLATAAQDGHWPRADGRNLPGFSHRGNEQEAFIEWQTPEIDVTDVPPFAF